MDTGTHNTIKNFRFDIKFEDETQRKQLEAPLVNILKEKVVPRIEELLESKSNQHTYYSID
ncbi:MAG: hypothetical protein MI922_15825, partial [Bacteroidales bacterium]|nr:hypothetical protein [Bacteroidales bacterium]